MKALSSDEVLKQSRGAMAQWEPRWREDCKRMKVVFEQRGKPTHRDFLLRGTGRRCVLVGLGASLEKQIPYLREYQNDVDIMCVDKGFQALMEKGITPKLVMMADALVDYDKYLKPWIERTTRTILVCCVTGNPLWPENWRGPVYMYVNKDNINSEVDFSALSGVTEAIPAGSNVGNALVCFTTQLFGYDRFLLIGFDFCWAPNGNYYAFQWESGKRGYMKHIDALSIKGEWVYSSANLNFSSRWLKMYLQSITSARIAVRNCSSPTILEWPYSELLQQLKMARAAKQRAWTQQEAEQFFAGHAQQVDLRPDQLQDLNGLLSAPAMQPLTVSVRSVTKECVEFAKARIPQAPQPVGGTA